MKYPLLTQKQTDFKLFCLIIDLINKKEHLTLEGIEKIINIRASMNKKLIDRFNKDFPNIKPIKESFIVNIDISDLHWITGFVDAEGCFYIKLFKDKLGIVRYSIFFSLKVNLLNAEILKKLKNI